MSGHRSSGQHPTEPGPELDAVAELAQLRSHLQQSLTVVDRLGGRLDTQLGGPPAPATSGPGTTVGRNSRSEKP